MSSKQINSSSSETLESRAYIHWSVCHQPTCEAFDERGHCSLGKQVRAPSLLTRICDADCAQLTDSRRRSIVFLERRSSIARSIWRLVNYWQSFNCHYASLGHQSTHDIIWLNDLVKTNTVRGRFSNCPIIDCILDRIIHLVSVWTRRSPTKIKSNPVLFAPWFP